MLVLYIAYNMPIYMGKLQLGQVQRKSMGFGS